MKNLIKISLTTLGTIAILGTSVMALTGTVNSSSGLVLRKAADRNGEPITTVPSQTEVNIIEKSGEWYKVTYNSQEGYLFAEYVNATETPQETTTEDFVIDGNDVEAEGTAELPPVQIPAAYRASTDQPAYVQEFANVAPPEYAQQTNATPLSVQVGQNPPPVKKEKGKKKYRRENLLLV